MTRSTTIVQEPDPGIMPKTRAHKVRVRLAVMEITAKDISEFWGCTPQQFMYWQKSDDRRIQPDTLERLAEILGVSIQYLTEASWDGLFAPVPQWLAEKQSADTKRAVLMEKIQADPPKAKRSRKAT